MPPGPRISQPTAGASSSNTTLDIAAPIPPPQEPLERHSPTPVPPSPPLRDQELEPEGAYEPLPDPEYGHTEETGAPRAARLRELQVAQEFIQKIRDAKLEDSHLSAETIARLHNPCKEPREISPCERAALRMFLARGDTSEQNYADHRAAMMELHSEDAIPTYNQLKKLVAELTGIVPLHEDMCVNTCMAFTGAYSHLEKCRFCGQSRYETVEQARTGKKIAWRTFHTFPLGPQIQAMYASPDNAAHMNYRAQVTRELLGQDLSKIEVLEDIYHSSDYLDAVQAGEILDDDTVVMLSLDGAQLYESKQSDCWFYIWVLYDLSPDRRYKKRYVLPGGVIPGPKKPKNVDSFLFPGLHHVSALRDGLSVWHAARRCIFCSRIYVLLATADGPGMSYLSGLVGHQGCHGCRLYCGMLSRYKASASTYYPAMLRPLNYEVQGSSHPDYSVRSNPEAGNSAAAKARYDDGLRMVEGARTQAAYHRARLETGIAKPSIFSGLSRSLGAPKMFPADLMHLIALNLPNLVISLLWATLPCDGNDDKSTWHWAVLKLKPVWKHHGELVEAATRYLPGSFERPPRNPAEKISSGYKAWEYLLYVYGLLPGLLRSIQQPEYYQHFCKLVVGVRLVLQRILPTQHLLLAHRHLVEHAEEFERLYYQRRAERLHFVRQSIHATTHIAHEAFRVGPGALCTQWTMENYIGSITREMKQHVTPYANVSERALRRCQANALKAIFPELANEDTALPQTCEDLGGGYVLLRARDRNPWTITNARERDSIFSYLASIGTPLPEEWVPQVFRWARLQLPNGQIARTAWKECMWEGRGRQPRRSRMVKLAGNKFAEVQYFFRYTLNGVKRAFAMVSMFSPPDRAILTESVGALLACMYQGDASRAVIPITDIMSVIAMVPLPLSPHETALPSAEQLKENRFFVVEKLGLEVALMAGTHKEVGEMDPDDDTDV
ncbi:hypothetical protein BV20DRAFT_939965 [Pilatotrama ljubarskyi]|nr:hypothetical protein BV20DRAFT_939965 [Pilatotrama ljubarskyi]